jgi:predicted nucleic acid-binding protein
MSHRAKAALPRQAGQECGLSKRLTVGRVEALSADPDDEYLIDLARAAGADALVSGDAHLLDLRGVVPVMTPAQFLASLASH